MSCSGKTQVLIFSLVGGMFSETKGQKCWKYGGVLTDDCYFCKVTIGKSGNGDI